MFLLPSLSVALALVSRSNCHFVQTIQACLRRPLGAQRRRNPAPQAGPTLPGFPPQHGAQLVLTLQHRRMRRTSLTLSLAEACTK